MLSGFSFYQRAEIKDALAYARLSDFFTDDDIALLRVTQNTPPRGIGKTTVDSLTRWPENSTRHIVVGRHGKDARRRILPAGLSPRSRTSGNFNRRPQEGEVKSSAPADFMQSILIHSGYLDMLMNRGFQSEEPARADNLREAGRRHGGRDRARRNTD